ncbi:MAG: DinB family protein, partial [Candidatus Acidiferrales bacterium]
TPADFADLAALRARWSVSEGELDAFVSSLTQEKLNAEMETRTLDGTRYVQPLWQMMQHLVNHGSYHRGQVATFLRQLGHKPVSTDLSRFYRERAVAAKV